MEIKVGKKKYELKFTFNSFRYIEDLDMLAFEEVDKKPFKALGILSYLFYGAVNYTPNTVYTREESDNILMEYLEAEGSMDVGEFINELVKLLTDSNFFKKLQK